MFQTQPDLTAAPQRDDGFLRGFACADGRRSPGPVPQGQGNGQPQDGVPSLPLRPDWQRDPRVNR